LARDYRAEYGKKVDPRTIANDIADMRKELGAPIHYDSEKRGYVYTDSSFKADIFPYGEADISLGNLGISGISALGLDRDLLPLIPSSVFLSEWHRNLLRTVTEKVAPAGLNKGRSLGKITVIRREEPLHFPAPGVENAVLEALEQSRELSLIYAGSGGAGRKYLFRPYHLLYLENENAAALGCFVLGEVAGNGDPPYALLNAGGIKKAGLLDGTFGAVKAIHVHQTDGNDILFLLVNEKRDTLLVVSRGTDDGSHGLEFSVLSRMDSYSD
jgi:hypothetical protein